MLNDNNVMTLVKSMIQLSANMDIQTVAEGVETLEQAQTLKELGCDYAQGFYFAKPMSFTDTIDFIRDNGAFEI